MIIKIISLWFDYLIIPLEQTPQIEKCVNIRCMFCFSTIEKRVISTLLVDRGLYQHN